MNAEQEKSIVLNFSEGSSDKTYQAQIKAEGDGFVVDFQFGRRGGPLQSGRKMTTPVPYAQADKVYAKLIQTKRAKGYSASESGVAYQGTANQGRVSGYLPQLLNAVDADDVERLLGDPHWCLQEKHDGERRMLKISGGDVIGINRKGLTVPLPEEIVTAARHLPSVDSVIDGELVGSVLHVFDVIRHDGVDVTHLPLSVRLSMLNTYSASDAIRCVETVIAVTHKAKRFESLRDAGSEGAVFKNLGASYTAGRPNAGGDALKFKFVATCSVRVGQISQGKRSVGMQLIDETGTWIDVGNVTIPPNHEVPKEGEIIEASYLYAYRGGSLFQPVYLGPRHDIDEVDCRIKQLQYKQAARIKAA